MKNRRLLTVLWFACMHLCLSACATKNVDPSNVVIASTSAGSNKGGLVTSLSPTDATFQAEQARVATNPNLTQYDLWLDGDLLYDPEQAGQSLYTVTEGAENSVHYLDAGPHHFTIAAPGQAPIFDGDGQIPAGGNARLFLYGPLDALQGLFVSLPDAPTAGNEHVTVVNLMPTGQAIEVVSCTDAATCTVLSPVLALGDIFDAEVSANFPDCAPTPSDPSPAVDGCGTSLTSDGAGIGYRLVPSASLPNPPVLALTIGAVYFYPLNPLPDLRRRAGLHL